MVFAKLLLVLPALSLPLFAQAYSTNFNVYSDEGCGSYVTTYQTDVTDGSCNQIPGYGSVDTQSVAGGCSLTVYTDSNCSDNAITAGVGACVYATNGFYSYSVDC